MTKAELIRKIVKRSGIPDSETKVFFEIFLQKTSGILRPGQAIKLKNFGYFQLRLAVFKTTSTKPSGKINQINTEVIVYSSFDEKETDGLVFNIPAVVTGKYNYIDSYFSLSTGKPVIPMHGVKETDYFILPTGFEMKKLIESKVDKLLEDAEIIKNYVKDNEILFLKRPAFEGDTGDESNWRIGKLDNGSLNETVENNSIADENESDDNTNFSNITWDFGEDLSRQIEEEALIDESLEQPHPPSIAEPVEKSNLEWEFDEQSVSGEAGEFEDKLQGTGKNTLASDEEAGNNYQRVKALTSEFRFDEKIPSVIKNDNNLSWDFGGNEPPVNEIDEEKPVEKSVHSFVRYNPVSTTEENNDNTIDTMSESDDEKLENTPDDHQEDKPEIKSEDAKQNVSAAAMAEIKARLAAENPSSKTRTRGYQFSNRKSFVPFLIAMFTIIVVSAVVFMYINKISLYDFSTGKFLKAPKQIKSSLVPTIIDRSFEIPVTYPYPKDSKLKVTAADSELTVAINKTPAGTVAGKNTPPVKSAPVKNNIVTAAVPVKNNPKASIIPKASSVKPGNTVAQPVINPGKTISTKDAGHKVKDNIFQVGNSYLVQVSSWHEKTNADKEAAKYKSKGYTSLIEKADIPGRGTWYRVKIGNFKSADEAAKFAEKNK